MAVTAPSTGMIRLRWTIFTEAKSTEAGAVFNGQPFLILVLNSVGLICALAVAGLESAMGV